jgi:cytochrome c-type biogenesis protein CcmE
VLRHSTNASAWVAWSGRERSLGLPDLFRENQGVVAHGKLGRDGIFVADEILAKHDENYMPPEVARAIKEKHGGVMPVNPDIRSGPRT